MTLVKYACTHCGRRFDAEEAEHLECPGCFWSTSVKRAEDAEREEKKASKSGQAFKFTFHPWMGAVAVVLGIVIIFSLLATGAYAVWPSVQSWFGAKKSTFVPKTSPQQPLAKPVEMVFDAELLTESQKKILNQKPELPRIPSPTEAEMKILQSHASFQTGLVEKLPSQMFTLDQFKELIKNQEQAYRMPLPWSYRGKLEKVFKEKYIPGTQAFEKGDLVQARNLWMESIIFPVYANDVRKHRAVVLTMLRPFINDTLSKIGAINTILVERQIRDQEKDISESYEAIFPLIEDQDWSDAYQAVLTLEMSVNSLQNPDNQKVSPPPYPPTVSQVDDDIRYVLMQILTPPAPAVADAEALRQDLVGKKQVLEAYLLENVQKSQKYYDEAYEKIQAKDWAAAEGLLVQVQVPSELREDARKKLEILQQIKKVKKS